MLLLPLGEIFGRALGAGVNASLYELRVIGRASASLERPPRQGPRNES
jgi:hypothetical protein